MVPAFTGLGAPHWDPYARGAVLGLTRGTGAAHLARATLDGVAHQATDLLDAMTADVASAGGTGAALGELRVDGGMTANDLLMQTQADQLGVPVVRPEVAETTALGAAFLAGLGAGVWTEADLDEQWAESARWTPSGADVSGARAQWRRAVDRARDWARDDP